MNWLSETETPTTTTSGASSRIIVSMTKTQAAMRSAGGTALTMPARRDLDVGHQKQQDSGEEDDRLCRGEGPVERLRDRLVYRGGKHLDAGAAQQAWRHERARRQREDQQRACHDARQGKRQHHRADRLQEAAAHGARRLLQAPVDAADDAEDRQRHERQQDLDHADADGDRKSVVWGKSVSVSVVLVGRRNIKKKKKNKKR